MEYKSGISEATMRRLPIYVHLLRSYDENKVENISCSDIGRHLNFDPTQVRKDLEATGIIGKPRVGFHVPSLILAIEDFLGWNNVNDAFLAGAGNLGAALLGYERLKRYGVHIVAAFDSDPAKIGKEIYGHPVLSIDRMTNLAKRMHILIGIITVPGEHAQKTAEMMVEGGIRAIWNFSPVSLSLPGHIIVQNEELYYSLAALSRKLADHINQPNLSDGVSKDGSNPNAADPVAKI